MRFIAPIALLALFLFGSAAVAQSGAPEHLTASVTSEGWVRLNWDTPAGLVPSGYDIYRGEHTPDLTLANIYGVSNQYTDYSAVSGKTYLYHVRARYPGGKSGSAFVQVDVLPPVSVLRITSTPLTTAVVGHDYWYSIESNASDPKSVTYMLVGSVPNGMTVNHYADGSAHLYWSPVRTGAFHITLFATDLRDGSQAAQEFIINVADQPGTIRGFVKSTLSQPIANASLSFWWKASGSSDMRVYEAETDKNGNFVLNDVQAGQIYAYVEPPTDTHLPQWFSLGTSIFDALPRNLGVDQTLVYEFYLLANVGTLTPVRGHVLNQQGQPLSNSKVSFIRKEDFIHIGDTASLNTHVFKRYRAWRSSVVDTAVFTDFNGEFTIDLPVGDDYYVMAERDDYLSSFGDSQTNAMESRAVRIDNNLDLGFTLFQKVNSSNAIYGQVINRETGLSKQATIIRLDEEIKRGGGGGHTYRYVSSAVTDTNGVFTFDDLSDSNSYLLAIPMDPTMAPQYFHSNGGTTSFSESQEIISVGTVQNIDFELRRTVQNGAGSFYGTVELRRSDGKKTLIPGTMVFAERNMTNEIVGYGITDSTGTYTISGLEPGSYHVFADHPMYSYSAYFTVPDADVPMPASLQYVGPTDITRLKEVNFVIGDLRPPTGIEQPAIAENITLEQNYPNPFNPATSIRFSIPARMPVRLIVVNAYGEQVRELMNSTLEAGSHAVRFDADGLPSGPYFYQLFAGDKVLHRSMMLVK